MVAHRCALGLASTPDTASPQVGGLPDWRWDRQSR